MSLQTYVHVDSQSLTKVINILINAINSVPGTVSGAAAITAGTTRTQAGATALTSLVNRVDTSTAPAAGTTLGDGVKLPASSAGTEITIINNTANIITVYGNGTDTTNGVAGATGVPLPPGAVELFKCAAAGSWNFEAGAGAKGALLTVLAADSISAAGSTQGTATAMTADMNRVTTVAAGAGVTLPASAPGMDVIVINHGANPLQVYGAGTDVINDVASATGVSQMQGSVVLYTCTTAGTWYTEGLATGYSGGLQTFSSADALTATGSNQAGALALKAMQNRFTTVAASTGAVLPVAVAGMSLIVINAGANSLQVYGNGSDTINGIAGATGVALASGKTAEYITTVAGAWHQLLSA